MLRAAIVLTLGTCGWVYSQSADSKPEFEVASIKSSAPLRDRPVITRFNGGPGTDDPTRITIENYMLRGLISEAYQVEFAQVSGPDWMMTEKFDIAAKVPAGATKEQVPPMLQNLLAERFHLLIHREKKEGPAYDLVVAKSGPKFKESPRSLASENSSEQPLAPLKLGPDGFPALGNGRGYRMAIMNNRAAARFTDASMTQLAALLQGQLDHPVTNATGLTGKYDFNLQWVTDGLAPPGDDPGPPLMVAVQEQLGLKLEQKKGFVDMIVVDHIDKVPTEN
jgi:uncharacterized protein (TIGR03435 family)